MKKLKEYFDFQKNDFYDLVDLEGVYDGFNVKKKIGGKDRLSYFRIFITKKNYSIEDDKKPLTINTTHGKENEDGGLIISSSTWKRPLFGPIDLISEDEFFLNIKTEEFFKKNKKVEPDEILKRIEKLHIKPTKRFVGLWLRTKIIIWHVLLKNIVKFISYFFIFLLKISTGKKYTYNIITTSQFEKELDERFKKDEDTKEGKKLKIFDYEVPAIVFVPYSFIHLALFLIFWHYNYKPEVLVKIFSNNFLTIMYTILTLIMFEALMKIVPTNALKKIIKNSSILYFKLWSKKIKI